MDYQNLDSMNSGYLSGKSEYLSLRDTTTNLGYEGSEPKSGRYANLKPLGILNYQE